ncbi:DUF4111 domain-containing protein [Streptomyces sp. SID11233]|nr:DUF4111 domain-containing protein [Streptomyces sp. SID11233]
MGPRPAAVLAPVPHSDLVRASIAGIPELLAELDEDARNVLLTLARMWTTLATGEIRPKDGAADWALARLSSPVLEHARHLYLTCHYQDEKWSDELKSQVRPCAEEILTRIDRLLRSQE